VLYCDCLSVVARVRRIAARPPGCSRPARRLLPAARHPLPVARLSHLPYTAPVATTHASCTFSRKTGKSASLFKVSFTPLCQFSRCFRPFPPLLIFIGG